MAFRLLHRFSKIQSLTRHFSDYIRFSAPNGTIRLPLASPKVIGTATSRGNRSHQEDFFAFSSLSLDPEELQLSLKKALDIDWDPSRVGDIFSRQAVFVGIYDGHGGPAVAGFLHQELHGLFESVRPSMIPELFAWIKEFGGYFKRYKGGPLAPWITEGGQPLPKFNLEARAAAAFFEVDRLLSIDAMSQTCGATASVVILQSLDAPATPFFSAKRLALTVAHCGDTRVLLCSTDGGKVLPMTENHHADARGESIRLRRMMGSSLITDSYGESRWMGALANTRGLGDLRYKKFGVTAEPEVRTKLLEGDEWAYIVLVSDGVSSTLSDDEIVDLARDAPDPKVAAERILSFVQELGGEDNRTAIVIPLSGWGKIQGPDKTKELREYRRKQAEGSERQRRM
ncbi:protein serine/threonine phosphatase 2C [Lentinula raphanica]|uniref:Protein serine/threonine phosphatase 2C n=1 Tax=Lentinula raphanica TaxID=153919 RepID=A0AA38UK65_9AGAR|nr:phosphatase 2C-like domain-containing protein [Lentinula raphanica]KAJ3829776.1 protein serine/threonine phosphatase 2C [Lentinula raphanica]KAJ3844289.1 protein serine/threonine phosphatase 2C [Lentinula raphanica]KAJ3965685.1 protein serine/threonine phosphatase 2C [Lentinula raphanica]